MPHGLLNLTDTQRRILLLMAEGWTLYKRYPERWLSKDYEERPVRRDSVWRLEDAGCIEWYATAAADTINVARLTPLGEQAAKEYAHVH